MFIELKKMIDLKRNLNKPEKTIFILHLFDGRQLKEDYYFRAIKTEPLKLKT